jgi:hypothetical protein
LSSGLTYSPNKRSNVDPLDTKISSESSDTHEISVPDKVGAEFEDVRENRVGSLDGP